MARADTKPLPIRNGKSPLLVMIVLAVVFAIFLAAYQTWSLSRTASRSEVAETIRQLESGCRSIAITRMQGKILNEGRPMTRRELQNTVKSIESCQEINDQLSGMKDAEES